MSRIGLFGQISEVTDHLLLSGAGVLKPEKLRQKKITFIVNATIEEPSIHLTGVDYLKISIEDSPYARIDQYFDIVADKIKAAKDRGGRTLVHCVAGVSRSATLCMVYLLKHERMTLRQAYHYVKSARPIIRPNLGFWRQMIDYERRLRGAATVSMVETTQTDVAIPDVYCSELKRKLAQNHSVPKTTNTSRNLTVTQIPIKYLNSGSPTLSRSLGTSYRRSTSPSLASSLIPFTRRPPAMLASTLSRRHPAGDLFSELYYSPFSPLNLRLLS